jgi:hypothetical protein
MAEPHGTEEAPLRPLLILLLLPLAACAPVRSGPDDDDSAPIDDDDAAPGDEPLQLCSSIVEPITQVSDWRIEDGAIVAETWRSGGCEDWTYDLCWDGAFAESFPVQVWLTLQEFGRPDPCEAEVIETLRFSLAPLQDAYVDAYGPGPADIAVHFGGGTQTFSF